MASQRQQRPQGSDSSTDEGDQTTVLAAAGVLDRAFISGPSSRSRSRSRTLNSDFINLQNTTKAALRRELNRERGLRKAAEEDNKYADLHLQQLHDRHRVVRAMNTDLQEQVTDLKTEVHHLRLAVSQIPKLNKDLEQMASSRDELQTALLRCQEQVEDMKKQRAVLLDDKARMSARLDQALQALQTLHHM